MLLILVPVSEAVTARVWLLRGAAWSVTGIVVVGCFAGVVSVRFFCLLFVPLVSRAVEPACLLWPFLDPVYVLKGSGGALSCHWL